MENNFKPLYKEIYNDCILKLKAQKRPQIKLTEEIILDLKEHWPKNSELAQSAKLQDLKEILCILDNSQSTTEAFDSLLLSILEEITNEEILIYTLSVIQKQTIAQSLKTGNILNFKFFESFRALLKSNSPEIKEWALRTVESLGPMSMRLKKEILEAKPSFFKRLNPHQKNCADIIEYIESEWKRMGM